MHQVLYFASLDPTALSRPDKESMSQQTLMELLISDLDDKEIFRDSDGFFKDISEWNGLTLNENGEVTEMMWEHENTYGYDSEDSDDDNEMLPEKGGSIDFKWLPSTVVELNISALKLLGCLDTCELPRGMLMIDISGNAFEGSLVLGDLPSQIETFWASKNHFSGSLYLQDLPRSIAGFSLSSNRFSGTLCFTNLPETLGYVYLASNSFSGPLDLSQLPHTLRSFRIEENNFDMQDVLTVPRKRIATCVIGRSYYKEVRTVDGVKLQCRSHMYISDEIVRIIWPDE